MSQLITQQLLSSAMSFDEYLQYTRDIVAERLPREGIYLNDNTFRYTRSNLERMDKVLNAMILNRKIYNLLNSLKTEWIWLVLSEPWCGDASWGTPALFLISKSSDMIDFRILLRDKHPGIMNAYQTAGSDSIPKLVCLRKKDMKELGTSGTRPKELHQMVLEGLKQKNFDYRESVRTLHAWFEADMTKSTQEEMIDLVREWKETG